MTYRHSRRRSRVIPVTSSARRDLETNTSLWLCWRCVRRRARDSYVNYYTLWLRGATKTMPNPTKNIQQRRKIGMNLLPSLIKLIVIFNDLQTARISFLLRVRSMHLPLLVNSLVTWRPCVGQPQCQGVDTRHRHVCHQPPSSQCLSVSQLCQHINRSCLKDHLRNPNIN